MTGGTGFQPGSGIGKTRGVMKKSVRANVGMLRRASLEVLERRQLFSHFADHDDHGDHGAHGDVLGHGADYKGVEFCPPVSREHLLRQQQRGDSLAIEEIPPFPLPDTFFLHSRPSATKTIYLDFTGDTTTGTAWNNTANPTI